MSEIALKTKAVIENKLTLFESIYFKLVQNLSINLFEKCCEGEIEGLENLESIDGGFLLAANHSSYLDWLVLYSIFKNHYGKEIAFIAKEKLFKNIVWRKLIKAANCIKLDDSGFSISSMKKIYNVIEKKGIVGIFPEGTRTSDGELIEAKDGVAKIGMFTNAPIVPVGLIGFYDVWPRHKLIPTSFVKCKIKIGKPINIKEIVATPKIGDFEQIVRTVMIRIAELTNKKYDF
jgi:1-acyl-sn-glycerol-3-phosphate acyltransferase